MMIIWWSKHVGVILSVLICDIWIDVYLPRSALVGPLYIVNWNARWNSEDLLTKFWLLKKVSVECDFNQDQKRSLMMIIWWSKYVGVILSVLICDIWIDVYLPTSALLRQPFYGNHKFLVVSAGPGAGPPCAQSGTKPHNPFHFSWRTSLILS
jgi:hypothetical protein